MGLIGLLPFLKVYGKFCRCKQFIKALIIQRLNTRSLQSDDSGSVQTLYISLVKMPSNWCLSRHMIYLGCISPFKVNTKSWLKWSFVATNAFITIGRIRQNLSKLIYRDLQNFCNALTLQREICWSILGFKWDWKYEEILWEMNAMFSLVASVTSLGKHRR